MSDTNGPESIDLSGCFETTVAMLISWGAGNLGHLPPTQPAWVYTQGEETGDGITIGLIEVN